MLSRPIPRKLFLASRCALAFICLVIVQTALANDDQDCSNYLQQIPNACNNPNDVTTGYDPPDSGTAAAAQVASAQSAVASAGTSSSLQCQNQAGLNNALTTSANLKVKACQNIMKKCEDSCKSAVTDHQRLASQATDAGTKSTQASLATQFQQKEKDCDQYASNIASGNTSAAGTTTNSATSTGCQAASSTSGTGSSATSTLSSLAPLAAAAAAAMMAGDTAADTATAASTAGTPTSLTYNTVSTGTAGTAASVSAGTYGAATTAAAATGASAAATSPISSGVTGSTGGSGGSDSSSGGGSTSLGSSKAQAAILKNTSAEKVQKAGDVSSNNTAVGGGGGGGFGGGGRDSSDLAAKVAKAHAKAAVSGMSLKPVDGITGPVGATLFEKVSQQYQLQKHTLIHDPSDSQ